MERTKRKHFRRGLAIGIGSVMTVINLVFPLCFGSRPFPWGLAILGGAVLGCAVFEFSEVIPISRRSRRALR